ncbi:hypothetical protein [Bradyrhizobium stylosanthis]|uniref:hypothetical protein n=1 Tax=Bradyrhizobium stylosanthis TaxID=1803665 RepID=UPI0007C4ED24|nr:hypothetical protein [Bradyrhizobium stylosanthis]
MAIWKRLIDRKTLVRISQIGTFVFVLLYGSTFFVERPDYEVRLLTWFFALFFLFHWWFGAMKKLTPTKARLIDYVYLGIAAVGVFVLAINYQHKRYEYTQLEVQDEGRRLLGKEYRELLDTIKALQHASCIPEKVQLVPLYCEQIKKLNRDMQEESESETRLDFSLAVDRYLRQIKPPDSNDALRTQSFRQIGEEIEKLRTVQDRIKLDSDFVRFHAPISSDDVRISSHGLFAWPFILAFALALRITKTTIEVLDWAK